MPRAARAAGEFRRERRDLHLEELIRRVQLVAGRFDELDEKGLRTYCRNITKATSRFNSPSTSAIACTLVLDVIVRVAISKHSPPNVALVFSAAKLCGRIDVHGMAAALVACTDRLTAGSTGTREAMGDLRVETAIAHISNNHAQATLTLRSLAEHVHLSPWHLDRLLVLHTGTSFKAHLQEARLRHVAALLEQTFLSIKEIAHSCGYGHVETLERAFRKRFGYVPTCWRGLRVSMNSRERQTTPKFGD